MRSPIVYCVSRQSLSILLAWGWLCYGGQKRRQGSRPSLPCEGPTTSRFLSLHAITQARKRRRRRRRKNKYPWPYLHVIELFWTSQISIRQLSAGFPKIRCALDRTALLPRAETAVEVQSKYSFQRSCFVSTLAQDGEK